MEMIREAREAIERALAALPADEEYPHADRIPGEAYELGRKDGLRHALTLLDELTD